MKLAASRHGAAVTKPANPTHGASNNGNLSMVEISMRQLALIDEQRKLVEAEIKILNDLKQQAGDTVHGTPAAVSTPQGTHTQSRQVNQNPPVVNHATVNNATIEPHFQTILMRQSMTRRLPLFSGVPTEWPVFITAYEQSTQMGGLTNADNLLRLQEALKGKARDAVESQLSLPECVPEIMSTLQAIFGRPELLIESQIESQPAIRADRLESIITFSFLVNNLIATLKSANLPRYLDNPMLEHKIVTKFPEQLKLNWAAHKRTNTFQVNMDGTLVTLASFLKMMAADASSVMSGSLLDRLNKRPPPGRVNVHEEQHEKVGCVICSGNCIAVDNCPKFRDESRDGRWQLVKQFQLCRTCLKTHGYRCDNLRK